MNASLLLLLGCILAAWFANTLSSLLDARRLSPAPPQGLEDIYDPEEYARSQRYARARLRFGALAETWDTLLVAGFLILGGFPLADELARQAAQGLGLAGAWAETATGLVFFAMLGLAHDLAGLPFSLYHTFVLEDRFGFNRTSPATFVLDRLKGWLLAALIGGPLLAVILWLLRVFGPGAWVGCWAIAAAVSLLLAYVAPTWILPLFNKFSPLEDDALRADIEALAQKEGFALSGLFVMDGSRRSAKGNAFFTGLGRRKRIALFDTLLEKMNRDEILGVLAHEVGHWKLGHIRTRILIGILRLGALLWLLSLLLGWNTLFADLGLPASGHAGLALFSLLLAPASLLLGALTNALSRRHEYQADRFAARATGAPLALSSALKKLVRQNLANLTPHPLSVFLFHSHPPLPERLAALDALAENADQP
ncbi:M48 family metallopeptidase [Paucidesulfovibrio longus]|uniref:M48 family metallopeptidase n=1 Tax=Paucidesulfovibrio longus TaxID=889 RepID=UPI0003B5D0A5|nr:M48 family metallopeptidase [Paucidesulfovibrio longus]